MDSVEFVVVLVHGRHRGPDSVIDDEVEVLTGEATANLPRIGTREHQGGGDQMPEWLSTTVALVAGGLLTMLTGWVADRRLSARERERREDERRDRLRIRRSDFQRDTMLALQVASQKLLRTTGAMNHQDVVAFRKGGRWQRQLYPEELSDGQLQQVTETMLLSSRVHDDAARALTDQLREQCVLVGMSADEAQAQARMTAAASTQQALIERIGHLVRTMDDAD